ncbi:MAG: hypothetical protein ABIK28_22620, partial [Planctomycetota bacterium]
LMVLTPGYGSDFLTSEFIFVYREKVLIIHKLVTEGFCQEYMIFKRTLSDIELISDGRIALGNSVYTTC